jgi:CAAX protease family protein
MQGCSPRKRKTPPLMLAKLFLKDARLRPFFRVLVFVFATLFVAAALWLVFDAFRRQAYSAELTWNDLATGEFASVIAVVLVSVLMRRYVDRRSVASLGFAPGGPWLRLFGWGVLLGAGMQTIAMGIESALGVAHVVGFGSVAGDAKLIAVAAAVFLAGALSEELSLRGYILQNLWEEWGVVPAIAVTSVAFAAVHLGNPHSHEQTALTVCGLVVFALWASVSLLLTRSLWLAFGAHAAWNLFEGPVFGLPVSGVSMPVRTVLVESVNGPRWLTGGSFGPEAGLSSILALLVGFVALLALYKLGAFRGAVDSRETYARTITESSALSSADHARS